MPRYWVIAPVESEPASLYEEVWQFDLANGIITIGWHELGDVSTLSRDELKAAVTSKWPERPPPTCALISNMIWNFYHEILAGDVILARRGRKSLAAVGRVIGPAQYKPSASSRIEHPHVLSVRWQDQPRDRVFSTVVFPMYTLAEWTEDKYRAVIGSIEQPASDSLADPYKFPLEKYLEDFIVSHFDTIFRGQLRMYEGEEGNGQQYPTETGPIDILAVEPTSNAFVVIELKKGRPSDQVVGQVLRYMGWVKMNLCVGDQLVKGLVICGEPDPKMSYALEMTNNIEVRYYSVSFKLSATPN